MEQPPPLLPRRIHFTAQSLDEEVLRCDSSQSPTESSQKVLGDSAPPRVSSRAHVRRQYSEPTETVNVREQIKRFSGDSTPPVFLPRQNSGQNNKEETMVTKGTQRPSLPTRTPKKLLSNSLDDEQRFMGDSAPPPVLPRLCSRQNSGQNDTINEKEETKASKDVRPPPLPKRTPKQIPSKSLDDEQINVGSANQSPTNSVQRNLGDSTPIPVLPKSWSRQNSGQNDTIKEEKKKAFGDPSLPLKSLPRQISGQNRNVKEKERTEAAISVVKSPVSYKKMTRWSDVLRDLTLRALSIEEIILVKAEHLHTAIQEYIRLMAGCGEHLEELINELKSIADNLDKVSKGTKIAGITGGGGVAAGGVAAAAGVILAPFTAGASLAITAVGVGLAAAGGVTGASAAIANKANLTQDQKKIQKTLQEFKDGYEEILTCLKFINEGMELLKYHGVPILEDMMHKNMLDSKEATSAVKLTIGKASAIASERSVSASGLLEGFALGMDMYFTKDGQKVKKGLESKLAKKLRKLAEDFELGLKELIDIKDLFRI